MSADPRISPGDTTRAIIEAANEAFISMDAGGFIIDLNAQAEVTFGWRREEAVGRILSDTIVPPRHREQHLRGLQRFLETGVGRVLDHRFEIDALHRDGHEFPVELSITAAASEGSHVFHAFLHDISERRRNEQFLAAQHATAAVLAEAETVEDALPRLLRALGKEMGWEFGAYWTVDERRLLQCHETWTLEGVDCEIFERASRELTLEPGAGLPGRVWATERRAFVPEVSADPDFVRAAAAAAVGLRAGVAVPLLAAREVRGVIEYFTRRSLHAEPELIEMMDTLARQIGRFLTILSDRARLVKRLQKLSLTDELTGLPNRRAWDAGLRRDLARAGRRNEPICVALLDLDAFKAFNDRHGHRAGDAALQDAAHAWSRGLRATDLLARYGGEEFTLSLPGSPLEGSLAVVERLRAATPAGLTCSAGLAAWRAGESAEQLIDRADMALYEAKHGGRNRTVTDS